MAIIPQMNLFSWNDCNELGDLERLKLVLDNIPDEGLMDILEKRRANGRNDYPIRSIWNTILAGIVFEHKSIESLRRELSRNAQLRLICGIYNTRVPPEWVYTRFLKNIMEYQEEINNMFYSLVREIKSLLPNFGEKLSIDSKAINSYANNRNKNGEEDGRRDTDADYGKKNYQSKKEDGTLWTKIVKWFGYKLHLIVDSEYELPVEYSVTKASVPDINEAHNLVDNLKEKRPEILDECDILAGDRGYDDTKLINKLWIENKIKPVIDIRNMWKNNDSTRLYANYENVVYDYKGTVYCYCLDTGERREMISGGFEESRQTLIKLCPAKHYNIECKCLNKCEVNTKLRIKLDYDRRIFTPIDRSSYKWNDEYNRRTSVERINGRIDDFFGFENHFIRGMKKMKLKCSLALCTMLSIALGRIRENNKDLMRCLTKSA
jgi:hypothetical protein